MTKLLLASSSIYRHKLLNKLQIAFDWAKPDVDETPLPRENPIDLVRRLAEAKARRLSTDYPDHLIIGSDQVACHQGQIIGKPGNFAKACEQLLNFSGKTVHFYTGLCVFNPLTQNCQLHIETDVVYFRTLSKNQIDNYLQREQPFDCAGSFKSEGLGISLFTRIESRDPNSLVGLPLIALIDLLANENIHVLAQDSDRQ